MQDHPVDESGVAHPVYRGSQAAEPVRTGPDLVPEQPLEPIRELRPTAVPQAQTPIASHDQQKTQDKPEPHIVTLSGYDPNNKTPAYFGASETAILILASYSQGARASRPHSCGKHAVLAGGTPALPVRKPTRTAKMRIAASEIA